MAYSFKWEDKIGHLMGGGQTDKFVQEIEAYIKERSKESPFTLDLSDKFGSDGVSLFQKAIRSNDFDLVKIFVEKKYGDKPLDVEWHFNEINKDAEGNFIKNVDGTISYRSLMSAACNYNYGRESINILKGENKSNRDKILDLLCEHAKKNDILKSKDEFGLTPMMLACKSGSLYAVEKLLSKLKDLGVGKDEIKEYLNYKDNYNHTMGDYVYFNGNPKIKEFFEKEGYGDILEEAEARRNVEGPGLERKDSDATVVPDGPRKDSTDSGYSTDSDNTVVPDGKATGSKKNGIVRGLKHLAVELNNLKKSKNDSTNEQERKNSDDTVINEVINNKGDKVNKISSDPLTKLNSKNKSSKGKVM